jgi:nucleoside-diphosphate-sugar epimerase
VRTAVIGATGYIGGAVAERLVAAGHEVSAVSRRDNVVGYPTVPGDLTRPDSLARALDVIQPEVIVHAGNPTGDVQLDLADLFLLAIERAEPGAILHGVGEEAVQVSDVAVAADLAAGGSGRAEPWPVAEAGEQIGAQYAAWLALDQVISSARTRAALDWRPSRPTLVNDLTNGSYVNR